jgi:hypothetical protein
MYKTNQDKNYCEYNSKYKSFEDMYMHLVDRSFFGDFTQPHPKDLSGMRKWNVKSRYKAINFINAICYDGPKTIEFRMLRPTYNFEKILGWLFIYGAFIKFAEINANNTTTFFRGSFSTESIIRAVYSFELANALCDFLNKSRKIIMTQQSVYDQYGMRTDIDDKIINYQTFGHYFY